MPDTSGGIFSMILQSSLPFLCHRLALIVAVGHPLSREGGEREEKGG